MWFSILLLAVPYTTLAVDDSSIQEAAAILVSNTTDTNGTTGPDEDYIKQIAASMELFNIKKTQLSRQSTQTKPFDEKGYRTAVGPVDTNRTIPPETNSHLKAVALEGDMILSPAQINNLLTAGPGSSRKRRQSQTDSRSMWDPNRPIPYYIDPSLYRSTAVVNQAIKFWTDNTCLSFTPNSNAFNRLRIYKGNGCWSYVGKQYSWASQDVSIGDGCDNLGTVCHEIAHALGFYHTQSRSDRDNYIYINYGNVDGSLQYNFQKLTPAAEKHYGMAYDYGSVMQYNPYAFAINYNVPTSVARDVNYQNMMGQREGPAFSDVKQMNLLYNCAARCRSQPACQNNGIVNSKTCSTCICPRAFAGPTCNSLRQGSGSACNGQVLQATSSYVSFTMTVGNGMSYQYSSTPSDCYWHIRAPSGRRIQFQIKSIDTNCMEGCNWAGFEVNTGNLDLAGMLVCCSSISNKVFTSLGSVVTVRGTSRYNNANMVINFRAI
ncbi:hypothetical protein Y032_0008g150 [Ancylostoma ceylanicum]|uniref:Zinc metalloproteinase n=2 Tax=Ancylostoma ceylanicum TaxID=53326 RepID=A0A016VKB4_9BILA|nr:hypothetical protein Y032_0008g150 [Ancylostoma ceylanicum]